MRTSLVDELTCVQKPQPDQTRCRVLDAGKSTREPGPWSISLGRELRPALANRAHRWGGHGVGRDQGLGRSGPAELPRHDPRHGPGIGPTPALMYVCGNLDVATGFPAVSLRWYDQSHAPTDR